MKKRWVFIVLSLFLVMGIGFKLYMAKQTEKKEAEKVEVERMSVEALKNTFENIKSIEIEKSGYDLMTGSYFMFVTMTNQDDESVSFSYGYEKNKPSEIQGYILESDKIQSKGVTTVKVHVIYSNKEEGEV